MMLCLPRVHYTCFSGTSQSSWARMFYRVVNSKLRGIPLPLACTLKARFQHIVTCNCGSLGHWHLLPVPGSIIVQWRSYGVLFTENKKCIKLFKFACKRENLVARLLYILLPILRFLCVIQIYKQLKPGQSFSTLCFFHHTYITFSIRCNVNISTV